MYSRERERKFLFFMSSVIIERQIEMESCGVKRSIDGGLPREELTNVFFFIDHLSTFLAFECDISAWGYFHSRQISSYWCDINFMGSRKQGISWESRLYILKSLNRNIRIRIKNNFDLTIKVCIFLDALSHLCRFVPTNSR